MVNFVKRHPEWRDIVWEFLFTDELITDDLWEPLFNSVELVAEFGDKITANAAELYKEMENNDWAEGIAAYGKPLEDLFNAAGIFLTSESKEKIESAARQREMIAEEARKSKEIGAKREAEAAEERKKEKARKAARSDQEVWEEALEEYYIDKCLTECDRFRPFIEKDIAEIKDIHSDGNPAILINPPAWLVSLFKANGVEFVGDNDADDAGEKLSESTSNTQSVNFSDKRVCVTGKLSQTRKEIEAALEAAGATIASAVSKTTDILIAGAEAGSKLAKAKELSIQVMTEEEMNAALGGTAAAVTTSEKAVWDKNGEGFTFEGEHFVLTCGGGHSVEVTVSFEDWEKHYKSSSLVSLPTGEVVFKSTDGVLEHDWEVFLDWIDLDLVFELFPELEEDDDWSEDDLTDEQLLKYYTETFKRGTCELRHTAITMEVYADDESEMERNDIARALGLDPSHTSVSYQG